MLNTTNLAKLWLEQRYQIEGKHVRQIIIFTGDGKLRDGNTTSGEFREFLSLIPSELLKNYLDDCFGEKFDENGLVLQDVVNQIGRRLGFKVTDGRYRSSPKQIGCDGLWQFPDGHTLIIEVKKTDAYPINLDTLARYRRDLISQSKTTEDGSSILIVVGRQDKDTSNLEAQIRGSRYAWNVRLISVDALARLMDLKEEVEDPQIIKRISEILIPREFTKLDEIIDLVFSTAEDVKEEELAEQDGEEENGQGIGSKVKPVSFYDACIKRIEKEIGKPLVKRSRTMYSTVDETLRLTCTISKTYARSGQTTYWFAFHPHQKSFLEEASNGLVAFGCGSEHTLLLIPLPRFADWLGEMHVTQEEARFYWHVNITRDEDKFVLHRKRGAEYIDLNKFLIKP